MGLTFAFSAIWRGEVAPASVPSGNGRTGTSARTTMPVVPPLDSTVMRPSSGLLPVHGLAVDLDRQGKLAQALEDFARRSGAFAQRQPGRVVAGDRALQQPHALILDVQHETAIAAARDLAEVHLLRLHEQFGRLPRAARQLAQQLIQTAIEVGLAQRLLRRLRQVLRDPGAKKAVQITLPEEVQRLFPLAVTSQHQLVEVTALPAGRKVERREERLSADGDRAT